MSIGEDIVTLVKAISEHKKCVDSCEYDAGYFCYTEAEVVSLAESALEIEINRLIDERVSKLIDSSLIKTL